MLDVLQTRLLQQALDWLAIAEHPGADAGTRHVAMIYVWDCVKWLAMTVQMEGRGYVDA